MTPSVWETTKRRELFGESNVNVVAEKRLNSLIVTASPAVMEQVEELLEQWDAPEEPEETADSSDETPIDMEDLNAIWAFAIPAAWASFPPHRVNP